MDLILWRHAEAEDEDVGADDLARALTPKGERHAARMAEWLNRRLADSTRTLVSPARRCQQTAKALGRKFRTVDAVGPGATARELLVAAGWPDAAGPVLVVGHQPTLGLAASLLLTGAEHPLTVKKAAVWWLRHRARVDDGQFVLHAVQGPESL
jgi:phosphohistidine phosphatase